MSSEKEKTIGVRKTPNEKDKILEQVFEMALSTRRKFLELSGIDVARYEAVQKNIAAEHNKLAGELARIAGKEGAEIAKLQDAMLKRYEDWLVTVSKEGFPLAEKMIWPFWWWCLRDQTLDTSYGYNVVTEFFPPSMTGITCETPSPVGDKAKLKLIVNGNEGVMKKAKVNSAFKFAFTPNSTAVYNILPRALFNGWWLFWNWNNCQGTGSGNGKFHIKLTIEVEQLADTCGRKEALICSADSGSSSMNETGAIDYNNINPSGPGGFVMPWWPFRGHSLAVRLKGGHEAVIMIGCEIYAEIEGNGTIQIDLKSGSQFCFRVPAVDICKRFFFNFIDIEIPSAIDKRPWVKVPFKDVKELMEQRLDMSF